MNSKKIKKSLELSGNLRDFRYIKKLYDKGRLLINGSPVNSSLFDDFRKFVKQTDIIYTTTWDFQFDVVIASSQRRVFIDIEAIILRFETINITNSKNRFHLIKDLFVQIEFSGRDRLIISNIRGNRLTISKKEYQSNYWHSHLNGNIRDLMSRNFKDTYRSFCTGSGEINAYRMELNEDGISEEKATAFLLQLTTLVSWESIEGTPYKYFQNVISRNDNNILTVSSNSVGHSEKQEYYRTFKEYYKNHNTLPPIQFELTDSGYLLKVDSTLDKALKLPNVNPDYGTRTFYCIQDEEGTCYKIENNNDGHTPNMSRRKYIFRGQELSSSIIDEDGSKVKNKTIEDYIVKPELKQFLINKINNEINQKAVRQSTIDRYKN